MRTHTVSITDAGFVPPVLDVEVGDTVVWTNDGSTSHSVEFDDGLFSSVMSPGRSFTREFYLAGVFGYECGVCQGMRGSVVVA